MASRLKQVNYRVELCEPSGEVLGHFYARIGGTDMSEHGNFASPLLGGNRLVVEVMDDGIGGADPQEGTGLAGLADRIAAVGGWMRLLSPPGGPTTLMVELPCVS